MNISEDFSYYQGLGHINDKDALKIINTIVDEMPELLEEIAPEGWDKSIYRRPIQNFNSHSIIIKLKRNKRIMEYNIHKMKNPDVPFSEAKEKKDVEYFPDTVHYKATILFYLCSILSELSIEGNMKEIVSGNMKIFNYHNIHTLLPKVLAEHNLWPKDTLKRIKILDILNVNIKEDSTPFYKAVFRALKKTGYNWDYFNGDFAITINNMLEYKRLKDNPTKRNRFGQTAADVLNQNKVSLFLFDVKYTDLLDEKQICDAFNYLPPKDYVLAYLEVHNELPQHYPLTLDYYKSLMEEEE